MQWQANRRFFFTIGHEDDPVREYSPVVNQVAPDAASSAASGERLRRFVASLETGDLVLFGGKGWLSGIIRLFTGSRWTHVGMVIRLEGWREPLLLEANSMSDAADCLASKPMPGVTLTRLHERITGYTGEVGVRRRRGQPLSRARQRLVRRLVKRLHLRPYKNFVVSLLMDVMFGIRRGPGYSALFCSELVAELYRRLGWLPRQTRVSLVVPGHFGLDGAAEWSAELAPVRILKASAAPAGGTGATDPRNGLHESLLPRR